MYWPRGRVWGGSSVLNSMVYIRGHAYDYDRWEEEGAEGWSYADCLPYFKKSQNHELGIMFIFVKDLFVRSFVCLFVCLFVYLFVCLFACLLLLLLLLV